MIYQEWRILLACVLCGMAAMVFYDGLRILRRLVVHMQWLISLEDICYWIVAALVLSWLIFRYNEGNLRFFVFMGFIIGVSIVNWGISRWSVPMCTKILKVPLRWLKKFFKGIQKVLHVVSKIFVKNVDKTKDIQ